MYADMFGSDEQVVMPDRIHGWDLDDNQQRFDFEYEPRVSPVVGRMVTPMTDSGMHEILMNSCSNPFQGQTGEDGKPVVNEYSVTLHCVEILYIAEVVKAGDTTCFMVLGAYDRTV